MRGGAAAIMSSWKHLRALVNETIYIIRSRYMGSTLGKLWLVLNPIIIAAIYTLLMSYIFKVRLNQESTTLDYSVYLLIGMAAFISVSESFTGASSAITNNAPLVKNTSFPLDILPLSTMLSTVATLAISLVLSIIIHSISTGEIGRFVLLIPFWMALQYFLMAGPCLFLAAYGVFVRDVQQALPPLMTVLMFASPVFYTDAMVPESFRFIWVMNPLYHLLNGYREMILYNRSPDLISTAFLVFVGTVFFFAGRLVFTKTSPYFGERV